MSTTRYMVATFLILSAASAFGQTFPTKPLRIVAGAPAGVGDRGARTIAPGLSENLGQSVVVDNRGSLAGEIVSKAQPDGYTLLIDSASFLAEPLLHKMPYDPVRDFSPVTSIVAQPSILVVTPSLPVQSVKDLIALAKAEPGKLNYGSAGAGSSAHLAAELFNSMAGIKVVHVPFKGAAGLLTAIAGGEIQMGISGAGSALAFIKAGKVKPLAVTTAQPSALVPGIPTVAATGLPGYEMSAQVLMFAPAKTPDAIVNRLSQETARTLNKPEVKAAFFNDGAEVRGTPPKETAAFIKSEIAKWSKVIKEANIHAD